MKKRMLAITCCLFVLGLFVQGHTMMAMAETGETEPSLAAVEDEIAGSWIDDGVYKQPKALDTTKKTIEITSAEELAWISYKVMSGTTFAGYKITLAADIDLSGRYWQPIGGWDGATATTDRVFEGSFDGQGYIVRNMNINRPDLDYNGFFGCVGGSFFLSNLRVLDAMVIGGKYSSALIGQSVDSSYAGTDGVVLNCGVSGRVEADNYAAGLYYGSKFVLEFMNCYSDCLIEGGWSSASLGYGGKYINCWWNADICQDGTDSDHTKLYTCYGITEESLADMDYVELLNEPLMEYGADWVADENGYPTFSAESTDSWIMDTSAVTAQKNVYYITSPQELAYIAEIVNAGNDLAGKTVKLMKDVDLSGKCWTPIGKGEKYNEDENFAFAGMFDGNGYVISGLYMGEGNFLHYVDGDAGLFGYVSGTIQNVEMQNVDISAGTFTGAIAGSLSDGIIRNCRVSGAVSRGVVGSDYLGGICGKVDRGEITSCSFSGSVSGDYYVGGITGEVCAGEILRCIVDGTVRGKRTVGGIVGHCYAYPPNGAVVVKECFSKGFVIADGAYADAGGILGSSYKEISIAECEIFDCYTTCDVTAGDTAGGIAGYANGTFENCYSTGNVSGGVYAGMMFGGNASKATVMNCYWNAEAIMELDGLPATAVGMNDPDTTTALTIAQFKKKESFAGFDFADVWAIDADINGGMPYLQWQDVPAVVLPTKITLSESSVTIGAGEAYWLTAVLSPANSSGTIVWSSDAPSVASVSQEGCVFGLSAGTATITATSGSVSATCRVTVEARAENAYQLGEITVVDERGVLQQKIPTATCWAQIELTKETEDRDAVVVFATYDKNGRYLGMYTMKCDIPVGSSVIFSALIDNSKGEIAEIRAFVWSSITNPIPLGESKSFNA